MSDHARNSETKLFNVESSPLKEPVITFATVKFNIADCPPLKNKNAWGYKGFPVNKIFLIYHEKPNILIGIKKENIREIFTKGKIFLA